MSPDDFETHMRKGEYFHSLQIPKGMWFVIRLDGRGFTGLTHDMAFKKPFDEEFHRYMMLTVEKCMEDFQGVFATTHSDEISVLFRPDADLFDREVEKIVSTTAGVASARFTQVLGDPGTFDSRIWLGASIDDVVDYFSWRSQDALRGAINSWAYWTLRQNGATQRQATARLLGKNFSWKNEMLMTEFGINFNDVPAWHKRGTGFYFTLHKKEGMNPITQEKVLAIRRKLISDANLSKGEDQRNFLKENLVALSPDNRWCFSIEGNLHNDH